MGDRKKRDVAKYPRINEQYITKMIGAFDQYNAERIDPPTDDVIHIAEPDLTNLIGFCSSFLNRESITKVVDIVTKASDTYKKYVETPIPHTIARKSIADPTLPPKSMFGNFGSY